MRRSPPILILVLNACYLMRGQWWLIWFLIPILPSHLLSGLASLLNWKGYASNVYFRYFLPGVRFLPASIFFFFKKNETEQHWYCEAVCHCTISPFLFAVSIFPGPSPKLMEEKVNSLTQTEQRYFYWYFNFSFKIVLDYLSPESAVNSPKALYLRGNRFLKQQTSENINIPRMPQ